MSDYVEATLVLWGITTDPKAKEAVDRIINGQGDMIDSEDDDNPHREVFHYDDVYRGKLSQVAQDWLKDFGISYEWHWKTGDYSDAGLILYHAPTKETFEFDTDCDADIMLSLTQVEDGETLARARLCQRLRDEAMALPLIFATSQHERLEQISQKPALRAYLEGKDVNAAA